MHNCFLITLIITKSIIKVGTESNGARSATVNIVNGLSSMKIFAQTFCMLTVSRTRPGELSFAADGNRLVRESTKLIMCSDALAIKFLIQQ